MHERTIFSHATVTGVALIALMGCDAGALSRDAGIDAPVAPRDMPAGPPPIGSSIDPLFAPPTLLPDLAPQPLRSVPETYEQEAPATHELEAPTDHMPVIDSPTNDGMPHVPAMSTDPMPVISGSPPKHEAS